MFNIEEKDKTILREALEDLQFKVSLELEKYKGMPYNMERKGLTERQFRIESLLHQLNLSKIQIIK